MSGPWIVAFVALWVLVLVLAAIVLGLLRRIVPLLSHAEQLLQRADVVDLNEGGLQRGARVSSFKLYDSGNRSLVLGEHLSLPATFLFVDSNCEPCRQLTSDLSRYAHRFDNERLYLVLEEADFTQSYESLRDQGLLVYSQRQSEASKAFEQKVFPQAFAVNGQRRVLDTLVGGSIDDLEQLSRSVSVEGEIPTSVTLVDREGGRLEENQTRAPKT